MAELVTVTGDFGIADDSPAEGRVWFGPWLDAVHADPDPVLVTRARVEERLDESGAFSVELIGSHDPAWQTDGPVPYLVKWAVSGSYAERVFLIPDGPGPFDLFTLVDLSDPPTIVPTPVPGPPGPQGEVAVDSTLTGEPGTEASVEDLDPSAHKALLKFTIPRGDKGDKGDMGDQGPQGEVAVDSTVTGAPGSAALVEDLDPSAHKALLRFTIPRGDVGPTGPAIGGVLTTKGDLAARDASAVVRLPVGANGLAVMADSAAATGLRYGAPGWESVTLWADLPITGNWAGRRVRVTSGLGLCVALWTGTAWVAAPESDTGWQTLTLVNGWTGVARVRRVGDKVTAETRDITGAAATGQTAYSLPVAWRPPYTVSHLVPLAITGAAVGRFNISHSSGALYSEGSTHNTFTALRVQLHWSTADAWPTIAPA